MVKRIINVQEKLLRKAINLVSSGSEIIYSTCSILKEENERILESVSDYINIEPIKSFNDKNIIILSSKNNTLTICPNSYYEGFFIAKLIKK